MLLQRVAVAGVFVCLVAGGRPAAAADGLGAFAGLTGYSSAGAINAGTNAGQSFAVGGSGFGFGLDYRIALSEPLALHPFLSVSTESAGSDEMVYTAASHSTIGTQLQYRRGDYFFGGQLARHAESFSGGGGDGVTGSGLGFGIVGGWERGDGLFVRAHLDRASITFVDGTSSLTRFGIAVGYRWKSPRALLFDPRAPQDPEAPLETRPSAPRPNGAGETPLPAAPLPAAPPPAALPPAAPQAAPPPADTLPPAPTPPAAPAEAPSEALPAPAEAPPAAPSEAAETAPTPAEAPPAAPAEGPSEALPAPAPDQSPPAQ